MSRLWRNWMTAWCLAVGVFGIVVAGAGLDATGGPARWLMRVLNGGTEVDFDAPLRFSVALMGCVTLGWGLTLLVAMQAAHQLGDRGRTVWLGLTAGVAIWFVIDSLLSTVTGFGLNALSNTAFMAAFLLPIIRSGVLRNSSEAARTPADA